MSVIGTSFRPRLFAAGVAAIAIAAVALLLPTAASADGGASTSALADAGVLRLQLGASDEFRYEPMPGNLTGSVHQSISSASCKLNLSPPDNLVTFSPPANAGPSVSPYAGFFDNSIGVGSRSEGNGQPCGRIDPGQTLTMNLGSPLTGKVIDYAEIDIEGKFGATIRVQGYFVKASDPTHPVLMKELEYPTTGADSSPDSGDLDNYRIRFPKTGTTAVNRLVFSIVGSTGAASLEGGADGTTFCDGFQSDGVTPDPNEAGCRTFSLGDTLSDTTDSLFHLIQADGVLDCGDTATQTNAGITTTVVRLDNVGGAACTPIPYNQDSSTTCTGGFLQCIFLQKDLDSQPVQFFWKVTWAPEAGDYMVHETEFDFGAGFVPLQICGPSTGPVDPPIPGFPSFYPTPSSDPWCVVDTQTNLQPDGQVVVTETYFGQNDPVGHR